MTTTATTSISEPTTSRTEPVARLSRAQWWLIGLAVVCVAALVDLHPTDITSSRVPETKTLPYVLLVAHIFTASVALLTGVAQFWSWLRRRHPVVHRWTGRAYLFLGVFPTSMLAIPVALQTSSFGVDNAMATILFALLWFGSGVAGYRAARQHRLAEHRKWMIRSYAITLAKITNMLTMPLVGMLVVAAGPTSQVQATHDIAGGSIWLALTANLVIAEWWVLHRTGSRRPSRPSLDCRPRLGRQRRRCRSTIADQSGSGFPVSGDTHCHLGYTMRGLVWIPHKVGAAARDTATNDDTISRAKPLPAGRGRIVRAWRPTMHLLLGSVAVMMFAAACSGNGGGGTWPSGTGTPASTTPDHPSSAPSAPKVANPLQPGKYAQNPCGLLSAPQLRSFNFTSSTTPRVTDNGGGGKTCGWDDFSDGSVNALHISWIPANKKA